MHENKPANDSPVQKFSVQESLDSGRYGHVLKPDGSYIEPTDFMDQFSIHMHKNRMEAFQGMTPQEAE